MNNVIKPNPVEMNKIRFDIFPEKIEKLFSLDEAKAHLSSYKLPDWLIELIPKSGSILEDKRRGVIIVEELDVYDLIGIKGIFSIDIEFFYDFNNIKVIVLLDNDPVYVDGEVELYSWINGKVEINLDKQTYYDFLAELKRVCLELLETLKSQLEKDKNRI